MIDDDLTGLPTRLLPEPERTRARLYGALTDLEFDGHYATLTAKPLLDDAVDAVLPIVADMVDHAALHAYEGVQTVGLGESDRNRIRVTIVAAIINWEQRAPGAGEHPNLPAAIAEAISRSVAPMLAAARDGGKAAARQEADHWTQRNKDVDQEDHLRATARGLRERAAAAERGQAAAEAEARRWRGIARVAEQRPAADPEPAPPVDVDASDRTLLIELARAADRQLSGWAAEQPNHVAAELPMSVGALRLLTRLPQILHLTGPTAPGGDE